MEPNQSSSGNANDVSGFLQNDLKEMIMAFFTNPTNGHHANFQKSSDKAAMQTGILMGLVFVVYLVCFIIMFGTGSFSALIKMSLTPVIMMALISSFSFGIKSISGKPDFKQEMLTGGLCGIPLALGVIIVMILSFALKGSGGFDPMGGSVISMIVMLYLLLMMIGVFQQSLKAAGSNDTLAWFVSPAAIILAGYVTSKIMVGLM